MSLFSRIKDIIRSNINSSGELFLGVNFRDKFNFENFENYDNSSKCDNNFSEGSENVSQPTLEQEYYANLELPYGAGFDEIKASYKKLLKKYHPDKFYGDEKKLAIAQNVVKKLNIAYEYFCNKYNSK